MHSLPMMRGCQGTHIPQAGSQRQPAYFTPLAPPHVLRSAVPSRLQHMRGSPARAASRDIGDLVAQRKQLQKELDEAVGTEVCVPDVLRWTPVCRCVRGPLAPANPGAPPTTHISKLVPPACFMPYCSSSCNQINHCFGWPLPTTCLPMQDYATAARVKKALSEVNLQDPVLTLKAALAQAVKEERYEVRGGGAGSVGSLFFHGCVLMRGQSNVGVLLMMFDCLLRALHVGC